MRMLDSGRTKANWVKGQVGRTSWRGTGGALLETLLPGVTGESGEDEQTVGAALLGLDLDLDQQVQVQYM